MPPTGSVPGRPATAATRTEAAMLDAKADEIEDALMESAREAVGWLEAACHLHPHRSPLRCHGGVARRRRPGRRLVPASHQPRRRPAAPRPRRHLEPGPARRRGRRQVAHPGLPHPAQPAARGGRRHRPDHGNQADRAGLRDGAPGGRERRRGRRCRPGRDGPVQFPRRRDHRGTQAARRRVRGRARHPAEQAHAVAAAPAGRAEHPPHQEGRAPHHRRADRQRGTHRGRAFRRVGSADHAPGNPGAVAGTRAGSRVRGRPR